MGTGSCGARRPWSGQLWEGSEQGMVELGLVFSTYPFGLECSGNCRGATMEVQRPRVGASCESPGCCNDWDGTGEKWLGT